MNIYLVTQIAIALVVPQGRIQNQGGDADLGDSHSDGEVQKFLHSVAALTITAAQGQETQMPDVPDYWDPYYIEADAEPLLPEGFDVETGNFSWDNILPEQRRS